MGGYWFVFSVLWPLIMPPRHVSPTQGYTYSQLTKGLTWCNSKRYRQYAQMHKIHINTWTNHVYEGLHMQKTFKKRDDRIMKGIVRKPTLLLKFAEICQLQFYYFKIAYFRSHTTLRSNTSIQCLKKLLGSTVFFFFFFFPVAFIF